MVKIECFKCGHKWIPRKADVKACPRCRRKLGYQVQIEAETCPNCGHTWVLRKDIIYRCPKCQKFYPKRIERAFNMQ